MSVCGSLSDKEVGGVGGGKGDTVHHNSCIPGIIRQVVASENIHVPTKMNRYPTFFRVPVNSKFEVF